MIIMDPSKITIDTPVIEPPPGIKSNFVSPNNHHGRDVTMHTIMLALISVFLMVRLYTRYFISKLVGWDDYFCVLSWMMAVVFSGLSLGALRYGLGFHLWDIRLVYFLSHNELMKLLFAAECFYTLFVGVVKCTIFLFYYRVFSPNRPIRYLTWFGIFAVVCFHLALFFCSIFICKPIRKAWHEELPGKCRRADILAYFSGGFNIVSDVYILLLPMPLVWKLHMDLRRRLRIMAIFSIGLVSLGASIVRLVMTVALINDTDFTWDRSTLNFWGTFEVDVGIICACAMALPAFLDHYSSRLSPKLRLSYLVDYFRSYGKSGDGRRSSEDKSSWRYQEQNINSDRRPKFSPDSKTEDKGWVRLNGDRGFEMNPIRGDAESAYFQTDVFRSQGQEDIPQANKKAIVRRVDLTQSSLK